MPYAELHAKTNFSFLEGASHPDELVCRAAELGYAALAVTDRNSLAGVVRAHAAAKEAGLKLLIGAEITPDDAPPVVLLAIDRAAYGRLARLITLGRRRAEKGECRLRFEDVAEHAAGLISLLLTPYSPLPTPYSPLSTPHSLLPTLHDHHDLFGDRCYLLAELHYGPDDQRRLQELVQLSHRTRVPLVAASDVHFHAPERQALCDVLTAVRHGCTVATADELLFPNAQRYLKSPGEMVALFAAAPEAVCRTVEVAERCTFSLDELRYEYPEELALAAEKGTGPICAQHPEGGHQPKVGRGKLDLSPFLRRLVWAGARKRYPHGVPEKVRQLVEHELQLIAELRYEAYFLTVWDLVRFARERGILCQGRGSAANSAVCFCLEITSVDPERMDVLFERFISRERNEAPDIDVDFEHERREEVLQYLYEKYGRERAGMTAEVITYRPRSAVRDVGKALGLPPEGIDALAKRLEHFHGAEKGISPISKDGAEEAAEKGTVPICRNGPPAGTDAQRWSSHKLDLSPFLREAGLDPDAPQGRQLVALAGELVGFPRHLSQHTGGMVMTRGPLCELVPIENAAMPDRTVIQWNKDDLDELGILKVDCLALGMLTAIHKCFDLVGGKGDRHLLPERPSGCCAQKVPVPFSPLTLANIPEGDEEVYAMIRRADTIGVFQIESRAQMSMLPRLRPRCFYDLVIEVAIMRPGPIQGNMVHPYLRRRNGEEPVSYPNDTVRRVLEKTLGVPLFQEQAMRLAVEAAGFTPGEADQLRRAMGAWRRPGLIDQFRKKLIDGMRAKGFSDEYAEAVFGQIRGFGDYGFPESHAASFALLVYVSAWLKCHYPAAFTAALLNSQPMGFYAPAQLVRDAREHGVTVLPADVNFSAWDCTLERKGEEGRGKGEGRREKGAACGFADGCKAQNAHALRLGFRMINGLASNWAERIVRARGARPFSSLDDFARRTRLGRAVLARLAKAGVFGSLGLSRRGALWEALGQDQKALPLFEAPLAASQEAEECKVQNEERLPKMTEAEEVVADYRALGLSLRGHPLQFLRAGLDALGIATAAQLKTWPDGRPVSIAGVVLVRQRPGTAKGITFVTLEDETGTANLIVRPGVWKRYRQAALVATVMLARGRLQRQAEVIHVLVEKLEDLSAWMHGLGPHSRDFC